MLRVTAFWTGFTGAPGYSNFYFGQGLDGAISGQSEANTCAARVRTMFDTLKLYFPSTVRIEVLPTVGDLDPASGELEGEFTVTPAPAIVSGADPGNYNSASGIALSWRTGTVVAGRRLRGRTFLVPSGGNCFNPDGTPSNAVLAAFVAAAQPLVAPALTVGEALVVWHRPVNKAGGSTGRVTAVTATDKVAILRSRRD